MKQPGYMFGYRFGTWLCETRIGDWVLNRAAAVYGRHLLRSGKAEEFLRRAEERRKLDWFSEEK